MSDFGGPYQIRVHDGRAMIFVKSMGVYTLDNPRLKEIVLDKIAEQKVELLKWDLLLEKIEKNE